MAFEDLSIALAEVETENETRVTNVNNGAAKSAPKRTIGNLPAVLPRKEEIIMSVRPKCACRTCTDGVTQAPTPSHLIMGGMPTEAIMAHVLVSKYADHLPL